MITYHEFSRMKPKRLLVSLLRYNHHFLASEASPVLGVEDKTFIYEDWAFKKLRVLLPNSIEQQGIQ